MALTQTITSYDNAELHIFPQQGKLVQLLAQMLFYFSNLAIHLNMGDAWCQIYLHICSAIISI